MSHLGWGYYWWRHRIWKRVNVSVKNLDFDLRESMYFVKVSVL